MKNIAQPNFLNIELFTPKFGEQIKIEDFLTAVDEKISQLMQKCDLLTQYKKGAMQQIFSQALRFKDDDGRKFPDWELRRLSDIGEIITGSTPNTTNEPKKSSYPLEAIVSCLGMGLKFVTIR